MPEKFEFRELGTRSLASVVVNKVIDNDLFQLLWIALECVHVA